jgi:hypothetical protein
MEELDRYPWSGHSVLVGRMRGEWQETEYVLGQFGEKRRRAIQAYRKYIEEGKGQGRRADLVGGGLIRSLGGWSQVLSLRDRKEKVEYDARILGRGDFVSSVLREADKNQRRQLRLGERRKGADESIGRICREEGIAEGELRGGGQRKKVSKARGKISYQLCHELGMPMAEIARHVGVCTSAVSKAIRNFEQAMAK